MLNLSRDHVYHLRLIVTKLVLVIGFAYLTCKDYIIHVNFYINETTS